MKNNKLAVLLVLICALLLTMVIAVSASAAYYINFNTAFAVVSYVEVDGEIYYGTANTVDNARSMVPQR